MNMATSDNNNQLNYETYLQERKFLVESARQESQLFDKSILSLSGGAFVISLAFIRQIAPLPEPGSLILLRLSWICLVLSIVVTLSSIRISQFACDKQIKILEEYYFTENKSKKRVPTVKNKLAWLTKLMNIISIISFGIGVILLSLFAIKNLN